MDKKSRAGLSKVSPVRTCKTCKWYYDDVCCNEEWEGNECG